MKVSFLRLGLIHLAIILLLSYVVLVGGGVTSSGRFASQLITFSLSVILFGGWVVWRGLLKRARWPIVGLKWPLVAAALAATLSLLAAPDWRPGLARLSELTEWAALFYITIDLLEAGFPRAFLMRALVIVSGLALFFGVIEVYLYYLRRWQDLFIQPLYRLVGLLGHPNLLAGLAALTLPLVVLAWRGDRRAWVRSGLLIWGGCYLIVMLFASSRGGLLSLGVILTVWGAGFIWQRGPDSARRWIASLHGRGWIAGVVIGLAVAAFVGLFIDQSLHPSHGGASARLDIWSAAAKVIAAHFWLGAGPGLFPLAVARVLSIPPEFWPLHAHSVFWQVFAEFGLIGLLALLGLILSLARILWRAVRATEGEARVQLIGISAGLAGYAVQNLVDDQTHVLAPMIPLILILALAFSARPNPVPRGRAPLALLGLPLLLIGALQAQWLWAYAAFDQARQSYASGDAAKALALIQESARRDPALSFYDVEAGLLAAQLDDWPAAQTHFERAVTREGSLAFIWANLGVARGHNGDLAGGLAALESAAQLAPRSPSILLTAGQMAEVANQPQAAEAYYRVTLTLKPEWASRPFWDQTETRATARAAAVLPAPDPDDPYPKANAALAAGDTAGARRWMDIELSNPTLPATRRVLWQMLLGDVLLAEGDEAGAMQQYAEALPSFANPSVEGTGSVFWITYGYWLNQREPLPFDSVPGLSPLDVTPEMLTRFEQLSTWARNRGDCAGAQVIDRQRSRLDPEVKVIPCP